MRIWEITNNFPYRTVQTISVILLCLGAALTILGCFDVIWTAIKYTDDYNKCPTSWPVTMESPCNHGDLVWTWIASGIWGGFLVILVAVLGLIFTGTDVKNLRYTRDMFAVGCILLAIPISPAVIILSALEMIYDNDIFYRTVDNSLILQDTAKFVVPLLVTIAGFFVWIAAVTLAVLLCYKKFTVDKKLVVSSPRVQQPKLLTLQPPQQQAIVAAQPVVQQQQPVVIVQPPAPQIAVQPPQPIEYEVVPIPGPDPPPPYYTYGPHPMASHIDRINRQNKDAKPSLGPLIGPYPPEMLGLYPRPMIRPPSFGSPMFGPPSFGSPMFGPPSFGPPMFGPQSFGPPMFQPPMYEPSIVEPVMFDGPVSEMMMSNPPRRYEPPFYEPRRFRRAMSEL